MIHLAKRKGVSCDYTQVAYNEESIGFITRDSKHTSKSQFTFVSQHPNLESFYGNDFNKMVVQIGRNVRALPKKIRPGREDFVETRQNNKPVRFFLDAD